MIIADDEFVKINGVLLEGIFKSIEVSGGALVEEVEVEGKGKKPKQATGYEDCKVTIDLLLYDDEKKTKIEKLESIQNIFRKKGQTKPNIYPIVNEHVTTRGISKVIFKDFSSRETNKKDEIQLTLNFVEYEEIKITTTKTTSTKSSSSSSSKSSSSKVTSSSNTSNLSADYSSYLSNSKGVSPKISNTPAKEVAPRISPYSGHQNLID